MEMSCVVLGNFGMTSWSFSITQVIPELHIGYGDKKILLKGEVRFEGNNE